MKTFTLDEANRLLPVLGGLLKSALEHKAKLERLERRAEELAERVLMSGGSRLKIEELIAEKGEREQALARVRELLSEIAASGVLVKDLDIGLLDFPCVVDGETVLLCWKMGEAAIAHWHGMEEGFKGRKPIDGRMTGGGRPN